MIKSKPRRPRPAPVSATNTGTQLRDTLLPVNTDATPLNARVLYFGPDGSRTVEVATVAALLTLVLGPPEYGVF